MQKQEIILENKKCPLCGGQTLGNKTVKYYCKKCNVLFKEASD